MRELKQLKMLGDSSKFAMELLQDIPSAEILEFLDSWVAFRKLCFERLAQDLKTSGKSWSTNVGNFSVSKIGIAFPPRADIQVIYRFESEDAHVCTQVGRSGGIKYFLKFSSQEDVLDLPRKGVAGADLI
jgi:hypothetical protein